MFWNWFWKIISAKFANEKITPPIKSKAVEAPIIKKIPLATNQYYQSAQTKKYIILHHTAGGSAAGAMAGWAADPQHIATPYVIERSGDIYECFPPEYWAYHLGVKGNTALEKQSIGIEIVAYGQLTKATEDKPGKYRKGDLLTYTNRPLPPSEVEVCTFRNFSYFQKYTDSQIEALAKLLPYLIDKFKIPIQPDRKNFWEFRDPKTLPPGIWSHTTVRKDKVDVFPQQNLVDLVMSL